MTKDEALKQALEVIEAIHTVGDVACVVTPNGTIYLQPTIAAIKEALAQPEERNFCQRCGKRTADLTTIHTCTPPQIDPNQWAFDNGLEST